MAKSANRRGLAASKTFAVLPIIEDHQEDPGLVGEGQASYYGHCAPFCASWDLPVSGARVSEHGPWCESSSSVGVDGRDHAGEQFWAYVGLAELYTHGVYDLRELQSDLKRWHDPFVSLTLIGGPVTPDLDKSETARVFISVGEARRLAAGLLHAADAADRLLGDPNTALDERKRHA